MAEEALKRVKSDVRSVLLSAPRGVLKRSFRREYMSLVGQDVPFAKLGFRSMEDFVGACPDVVREGIGPTGEPTYFVVANAETQHVASLVARQKKPSLKVLRKATPIKRNMFPKPSPNRYRGNRSKPSFHRPTPAKSRHLLGNPVLMNSMVAANHSITRPSSLSTRTSFVPGGAERSPVQSQPPSLVNSPSANRGIPPWREEYQRAISFTSVEQLIRTKEQYKEKMICVFGYPGNYDTITQYDKQFRILLFNDYTVSRTSPLRTPVLNLFFGGSEWNIKEYRDPYSFPPRGGWKIKVWGVLHYKLWQTKGDYIHSLKAVYYERISFCPINRSVSNGHQDQMRITVSGNPSPGGRDNGNKSGAAVSPSMQRLSSSSSLDSYTDSPVSETSISSHTGSLEEWLRYQLKDKANGLWGRVLENQYKKDFKKEPPPNLLAKIASFPFIKTEDAAVGNPIVYLTIETKSPPIPKYVELSVSDEAWVDVVVVNVESPSKFHVQCLADDCSKALERLANDMNKYYSQQSSSDCAVTTVNMEVLYGVCWTESNDWCRAMVLSDPDSCSKVYVRYPDYGNVDQISVSSLKKLPNQFYSLSLQGVCCGLENFTDTSDKATALFEKLAYEKSCSILVTERSCDGSCDRYTVDLIPEDCSASIIDLLDQKLNPIETLVPRLPKVGDGRVAVRLVEVPSHDPSCVFVNITGKGTEKLEALLNDINRHYQSKESRDHLTKNRLTVGMLCCAQFQDEWHRVKVTRISPENRKVLVEYIDYGTAEEQDPSELMKPLVDNPLNNLPPQAVKCRLAGLHQYTTGNKITSELKTYIFKFLLNLIDQQELYLEMVSDTEGILYDNTNTSINDQLKETLSDKLSVLKQQAPIPSSPSSTTPTTIVDEEVYRTTSVIPEVKPIETLSLNGDVFPVNISHCVSPQNFTIQLNSQLPSLGRLDSDIQRYCRGSPPELKDCKAGAVGIGRYRDDGRWYRVVLKDNVRLSTRISGGIIKEVPVVFVDYGNEDCVSEVVVITQDLLHQLPFQGLPAQLHVPSGGLPKWSNDQFIQRIYDQQFYCHVKDYDSVTERYSVSLMDIKTHKLITDF